MTRLLQIDHDLRRRVQFFHAAQALRMHAEPFESVDELVRFAPSEGVIFVHDGGGDQITSAIASLESAVVALPVIGYREGPSAERIVDAIRNGAADYVNWPIFPDTLRRRLAALVRRAPQETLARIRRAAALRAVRQLSPREREVLVLVALGNSNKGVAAILGISHRTVEIHRANMISKLNQSNVAGAIYLAFDAGIVEHASAAAQAAA